MDHFAGLDVSVKETSVCIVDNTGRIVREVKVPSEPEALLAVLKNPAYHFKRIGLEAGPLSQWLYSALAEAGLPVICVDVHSADRWKDVLEPVWPAIGVNSRAAASAPMSCCLFAANVVRLQLCETGFPTKSGSSARAAFE